MARSYSLSRSKRVFFHIYRAVCKKGVKVPFEIGKQLRGELDDLQKAILEKNRAEANARAKKCEALVQPYMKKGAFLKLWELVGALAFALVFAIVVRQMWFEPYEIPTGSMRPTFMEKDRLVVSKTDFALNIPLTTGHFYFNPASVLRNGIVTFTGENMDISDVDTRYFLIFPGKKQFIKRLMGKPGDTLYFYGGQIYGIDKDGKDITPQLQPPSLASIEHIPFLKWEGQIGMPPSSSNSSLSGLASPIIVHQMGQSVAMLNAAASGRLMGKMLPIPQVHNGQFPETNEYSELWGFGNFAMARLLTAEEALSIDGVNVEGGQLYLELAHHPSLQRLMLVRDAQNRLRPTFDCPLAFIPLDEGKLHQLFASLYTSRFVVEDGYMRRYGTSADEERFQSFYPQLKDVPDGTYEFYHGKAYKIGFEGFSSELPSSHPLYTFSIPRMQMWFNLGIECNTLFSPQKDYPTLRPARYAYFRNGDLFVMGSSLFEKNEPALVGFVAKEKEKASLSSAYTPFVDRGPPYKKDGTLDVDLIKHVGLQLPEKSYLALGDNHAMSGDSRIFGFVPEANLRGGPLFIFWPPGSRFGAPNQPPYPWFNFPTLAVWCAAVLIGGTWWVIHRRRTRLPIDLNANCKTLNPELKK